MNEDLEKEQRRRRRNRERQRKTQKQSAAEEGESAVRRREWGSGSTDAKAPEYAIQFGSYSTKDAAEKSAAS